MSEFKEAVSCYLCGADDYRIRHQIDLQNHALSHLWIDDQRVPLPGPEWIVQCRNCGLVYVNPRIKALPELAHYSPEQEDAYFARTRPLRQYAYGRLIQQIPGWLGRSARSLLDVGCGDGVLLAAAREADIPSVGTELSPRLVEQVQTALGTEAIVPADLSLLPAAAYDVVALMNIVEHARQPQEMLVQAVRLLRPGGIVLIHTPNIESPAARLRGDRWHQLEPLEHLVYFSPATLGRLMADVGLSPAGRFAIRASRSWKGRLQAALNWAGLYFESSMGLIGRKKGPP